MEANYFLEYTDPAQISYLGAGLWYLTTQNFQLCYEFEKFCFIILSIYKMQIFTKTYLSARMIYAIMFFSSEATL